MEGRTRAPIMARGATETSALLGRPSSARGTGLAVSSSAASDDAPGDVEGGFAPDAQPSHHPQHLRTKGRGLLARAVAGAALVVACVALAGFGASRYAVWRLGDEPVADLAASAATAPQTKPRLLVAVISWQGGFDDTDAQERTWLPLLKDSSPDIKVDYRVFIGRDPEPAGEGGETEIPAEAYRRRRMLRFEGEQTRRSPRVENKAEISPSAGAGT